MYIHTDQGGTSRMVSILPAAISPAMSSSLQAMDWERGPGGWGSPALNIHIHVFGREGTCCHSTIPPLSVTQGHPLLCPENGPRAVDTRKRGHQDIPEALLHFPANLPSRS